MFEPPAKSFEDVAVSNYFHAEIQVKISERRMKCHENFYIFQAVSAKLVKVVMITYYGSWWILSAMVPSQVVEVE